LQGASGSVQSMAQLVGPFLFTLTFAYFIAPTSPIKLPGAPFLLAGALLLVAMLIAMRVTARIPAERKV
jgi:DHA1 family tetracycline resistance protein-like MFS transporter